MWGWECGGGRATSSTCQRSWALHQEVSLPWRFIHKTSITQHLRHRLLNWTDLCCHRLGSLENRAKDKGLCDFLKTYLLQKSGGRGKREVTGGWTNKRCFLKLATMRYNWLLDPTELSSRKYIKCISAQPAQGNDREESIYLISPPIDQRFSIWGINSLIILGMYR